MWLGIAHASKLANQRARKQKKTISEASHFAQNLLKRRKSHPSTMTSFGQIVRADRDFAELGLSGYGFIPLVTARILTPPPIKGAKMLAVAA